MIHSSAFQNKCHWNVGKCFRIKPLRTFKIGSHQTILYLSPTHYYYFFFINKSKIEFHTFIGIQNQFYDRCPQKFSPNF